MRNQAARHGSWVLLGEVMLLLAVGVCLYSEVLALPFFGDDPADLRWIEGSTLAEVWTSAAGVGYYRPLTFSLWWADRWLLGGFHPSLEHAANLVFHILNALLVAALARRLPPPRASRFVATAAGLLFISFPFSYQAIPWVASLTHPLAAFLVLASLLTAIRARLIGGRGLMLASMAFAGASFFAHESSVVVGVLAATLMGLNRGSRPRLKALALPAVYVALALVFLPIYFSIPRQTRPMPPLTLSRLTQVWAYLLQGLAFPVAPATRALIERAGWSDLAAAYFAAGASTLLLALLAWRGRLARQLTLALVWTVVAAGPASLVLTYDYVLSGPRVLYLASVGVSIAWAVAIGALASLGAGRKRVVARVAAAVSLGAILSFSIGFVRERQQIHVQGGALVWRATELLAESPQGESQLVVNFPAWLAPGRIVYPVGHEGVEFLPSFASIGDLVWSNGGGEQHVRTARFSNALPPSPGYYYGARGPEVSWQELAERILDADQVYLAQIEPDGPSLRPVGRVAAAVHASGSALAIFDGGVVLEQAEVVRSVDGTHTMRLVWRSAGPIVEGDFRVFAHAYGADGAVLGQDDGYPLGGLYPFWVWGQRHRVEEMRYLITGDSPAGVTEFAVGIYDLASGARLSATRPDGPQFVDDAVPIARFSGP